MEKLRRDDLLTLEAYHQKRADMRSKALAHKAPRKLRIGEHAGLYFEDRLTIQYQIQEMLRVERIFEAEGIDEELQAYNPLIPDGNNLKATFMIEYDDVVQRRQALERMHGIEDRVWARVGDGERLFAIADEDLERSNETKTSAVHFLRFQFSANDIDALRHGADLAFGIDHEAYAYAVDPVADETRTALLADFD